MATIPSASPADILDAHLAVSGLCGASYFFPASKMRSQSIGSQERGSDRVSSEKKTERDSIDGKGNIIA
jgi:hypothetical protein